MRATVLATTLVLVLPIMNTAAGAARFEVNEEFLGPIEDPRGYYYEPATQRWYYYDGILLHEQPPGFQPQEGQGNSFDLTVKETTSEKGWQLYVYQRLVNVETFWYRVESSFENANGHQCPNDSSTAAPICTKEKDLPTTNLLMVGPKVLSYVNYRTYYTMPKPHSGGAEAWAWLDDQPRDKSNYYDRDGPVTW
jgi:hypothetical protein